MKISEFIPGQRKIWEPRLSFRIDKRPDLMGVPFQLFGYLQSETGIATQWSLLALDGDFEVSPRLLERAVYEMLRMVYAPKPWYRRLWKIIQRVLP